MKTCDVEDQFRSMTSAGKFKSKRPLRQSSFLTRFWEEHPLSSELLEPDGRSCSKVPPTALQGVSTSFIRYATPKLSSRLNPIIRHHIQKLKNGNSQILCCKLKIKTIHDPHPFQTNVTTAFRQNLKVAKFKLLMQFWLINQWSCMHISWTLIQWSRKFNSRKVLPYHIEKL